MEIFYCSKRKVVSLMLMPSELSDAIFIFESETLSMINEREEAPDIPFHLSEKLFSAKKNKSPVTLVFEKEYLDFAVNFLESFSEFFPEESKKTIKSFLGELKKEHA